MDLEFHCQDLTNLWCETGKSSPMAFFLDNFRESRRGKVQKRKSTKRSAVGCPIISGLVGNCSAFRNLDLTLSQNFSCQCFRFCVVFLRALILGGSTIVMHEMEVRRSGAGTLGGHEFDPDKRTQQKTGCRNHFESPFAGQFRLEKISSF